jgi:hypothetical protein
MEYNERIKHREESYENEKITTHVTPDIQALNIFKRLSHENEKAFFLIYIPKLKLALFVLNET